MIEKALFALLTGPELNEVHGGRVFPLRAPKSAAPPFIIYQRISTRTVRSINGPSGLLSPRFQIDVYAEGFAAARELARRIRTRLDGWAGLIEDVRIQDVLIGSEWDGLDDTTDPELFRVMFETTIWHEE